MRSAPRISPALARRIDRAARAAHAFHRFAHHPLCGRYAGEVLSAGSVVICRGCASMIGGAALGVTLGLVLHCAAPIAWLLLVASAGLLASSGLLRGPKTLTRLAPALGAGIAAGSNLFCALAASLLTVAFLVAYRRRGPNRAPCASCPERTARVCSGFAPIVRRERAFQRLTRRWLAPL